MTTDDRPILSDTQPIMDVSTATTNNDDAGFDSMIALDASMHSETPPPPPPPQPKYFQGRGSFDDMRTFAECNGHAFCFVQQFPKDVYRRQHARRNPAAAEIFPGPRIFR